MFYLFLGIIGLFFIFTVFGAREGFASLAIFIVGFILWRLGLLDNVFSIIKWIFDRLVTLLTDIYSILDDKVF